MMRFDRQRISPRSIECPRECADRFQQAMYEFIHIGAKATGSAAAGRDSTEKGGFFGESAIGSPAGLAKLR
jgi:hypothetical protein